MRPPLSAGLAGAILALSSTWVTPELSRPAAPPPDGVMLTLSPGPGAGEVTLNWSGGLSPYSIYRSTDKTSVVMPGNLVATTNGTGWIDAPPPPVGEALFYEIRAFGCASDAECPTGHCADLYCCSTACTGTCQACDLPGAEGTCLPLPAGSEPPGECAPGSACDGTGTCLLNDGGGCAADADCLSGHCADGFCCDTACSGLCVQCDKPGAAGTCVMVAPGNDPHDDCPADPAASCGRNGVCSGSGTCALIGAGTMCAPASCAALSAMNFPDYCDGGGNCVDFGIAACDPYTCASAPGECRTSCTTNSECVAGAFCLGGSCIYCTPSPDIPDLAFVDANCDGIDGDISRSVFVSLTGNDTFPGTMTQPKRTIAAGIATAAGSARKDVLIGLGTYFESITLSNAVNLYGGYNPSSGWSRTTADTTRVQSPNPIGVVGNGIFSETKLQLLTISAASASGADAAGAGRSSFGILIIQSQNVFLEGLTILPGNASNGLDGANGTGGATGSSGGSASGMAAGGGGASSCGGTGGGGAPGVLCPSPGTAGSRGSTATGGATGAFGGLGGTAGFCDIVSSFNGGNAPPVGSAGTTGANGPAGTPGANVGNIDIFTFEYRPPGGGAGTAGSGGGGGGGGGSGGGTAHGTPIFCSDCFCISSGAGGGGGGGGCGGAAAAGGAGGGASFGIVSFASGMQILNVQVVTGGGGRGGRGGTGGIGGPGGGGGAGALGMTHSNNCSTRSGGNGAGGSLGGNGGVGGSGAGGTGGPVACVVHRGSSLVVQGLSCSLGSPGAGGAGGIGAPVGSTGPNGVSGNVLPLEMNVREATAMGTRRSRAVPQALRSALRNRTNRCRRRSHRGPGTRTRRPQRENRSQ